MTRLPLMPKILIHRFGFFVGLECGKPRSIMFLGFNSLLSQQAAGS